MVTVSIRPFKKSDVKFAHESIRIENWNCPREDVERMLSFDPSGCFVAETDRKRAGHVFSVNYGKLGWIGFLVVRAEHRRKGIATLLMKKAVNYLRNEGAETIKLEAVPKIADLYRKLGFKDEYDSLRFARINIKPKSRKDESIRLLRKEELEDAARFDAEYFGANRTQVLNNLYREYPKLCFASFIREKIIGYVMCRRAETGFSIAPWVCNPEEPQVARNLLMKYAEILGGNAKLYVGVPAVNEEAVEILRALGFEQYSRSIRMRLGKELQNECISGIFGIGGPEKG